MRPPNLMDPHINSKEGQRDPETSWTRRQICKETPTPHGPVYKFEGGSKRPRNLMDPYLNLKEGQGDPDTSWAPYTFDRRRRNLMDP